VAGYQESEEGRKPMNEKTVVETSHASIDTLSVTIRAIHVDRKQMTLAVFRQLPHGKETKESSLWGLVRYQGIFLVFSQDNKLMRREIDVTKHHVSEYNLSVIEDKIRRHKVNGRPREFNEQYYKSYSADYIKEERLKFIKRISEYDKTTSELFACLDQEKQLLESDRKREDIRYGYECNLMATFPQLFIAV
jgi:hypothetical protein